jgi:hypothetical protein
MMKRKLRGENRNEKEWVEPHTPSTGSLYTERKEKERRPCNKG